MEVTSKDTETPGRQLADIIRLDRDDPVDETENETADDFEVSPKTLGDAIKNETTFLSDMIASDEPKPKSVGFGTRFKNMIPSPFTSDSSRNVNQTNDVPTGVIDAETVESNPGKLEPDTIKKGFMSGIRNPLSGFGRNKVADAVTGPGIQPQTAPANPGLSKTTGAAPNRTPQALTPGAAVVPSPTQPVPPNNPLDNELVFANGFNNKKTLANGLMDFAFLTANANQLHYALAAKYLDKEATISIVLISISISFQLLVGVLLILSSYIQAKPINDMKIANDPLLAQLRQTKRLRWLHFIDHCTIALVFIIAAINIFIAAFAIGREDSVTNTTPRADDQDEFY